MTLPALTAEQRAASLEKAAQVRKDRAALKAKIKANEIGLKEVLDRADTDDLVGKMRVIHLIESLPGRGRQGALTLMEKLQIAENKKVRGLGIRQREQLLAALTD
ncbi:MULTISPECIES: integration host factor, actinobacterial type [Rhodococcus]|uniref:integration host factor, actinobacterial type n=1 Tax=Rhodococcus TaxID=1827 RepID=UPI0007D9B86D|nr:MULTISPECIES: integration host factor, actinobacterial type [Rhodococcus]WAL49558.1 integration host factor, actinobacterial type [Rhodococcus pyridinivorans]